MTSPSPQAALDAQEESDVPSAQAVVIPLKINALPPPRARRTETALLLAQALRPHQWSKNLLVFVPLVCSHEIFAAHAALKGLLAFAAFSCAASSAYLINDLADLEADRKHEGKKRRPFASGRLAPAYGVILAPVLLLVGVLFGLQVSRVFAAFLLIYAASTLCYTFWAKKKEVLDVVFLASLYVLRIMAGHETMHLRYSSWLLGFSMFLFVSLAVAKRVSELLALRSSGRESAARRGYTTADIPQLTILGSATGCISILVLALYLNSQDVTLVYKEPMLLWAACPMMLYWIMRLWVITTRGQMNEDPVLFAAKDRATHVVCVAGAAILWLAARGLG